MKFNVSKLFSKLSLLCLVLTMSLGEVRAQSTPGEEMDEADWDPDGSAVPIDGGVSLLVAAGVAYGVKRAYDKRKEDKKDNVA